MNRRRKGKTPSLISSSSGSVKFVQAGGKRTCTRNRIEIAKGAMCVEVARPGKMGAKTYSCQAMADIIVQTRKDLDEIELANAMYLQAST